MKKFFSILIFLCSFSIGFSQADFDMTYPSYDRIVAGGEYALFNGTFELDDEDETKNFKFVATNISFPDDWYFVLCSPEVCAAENVDTIDFTHDEEAFSQSLSIKVFTSTNPMSTFGELDLRLIDIETEEFVERHFTVMVAPAGIKITEKIRPILNYNSVDGIVTLSDNIQLKSFIIYDCSGKVVLNNNQLTGNEINAGILPKGLYIINLNTAQGVFREQILID